MPRGTCDTCGRHDAFLYAVPLTIGKNLFVCAQCLILPQEWHDDGVENVNSNDCRGNPYQTGWSKMGDVEREASVMSSRGARKAIGNSALALTLAFGAAYIDMSATRSHAADVLVREVVQALFRAKPGEKVDYSARNLTKLDLSGLDFKGALLTGADLYGADFTNASVKGVDLSRTRLDRAIITRADFSGANLAGATLLRPTIFTSLAFDRADSPRFAGANLSKIRVLATFNGADFRRADLSEADFGPYEARRAGEGTITNMPGNVLKSCDFTGATAKQTNFSRAVLRFSKFIDADLSGANFSGADLSKADLTGARLTGADMTGADLDGAILSGVKGLDTVNGLSTALNLDRVVR